MHILDWDVIYEKLLSMEKVQITLVDGMEKMDLLYVEK